MESAGAVTATRLRLVIGRLARRLRRHNLAGLTLTQLSAMASVEMAGRIRLGDLAVTEGVTPATLSRIVGGLADAGYLERTADPTDRRSGWVSLTEAGHAVLAATRLERTAVLAARLDRLSAEDTVALRAALPVLERLVDSFDELTGEDG